MSRSLEVVLAGAGSGKTTDLCQTVAEAVGNGVDPARILATTFTRKAAAELKRRVQARLLEGNKGAPTQDTVDRLELATIGTVHSMAHQLITRYAIHLGLSPRLKVMTETLSERVPRDLLGAMDPEASRQLNAIAGRLSYDALHATMLQLLAVIRGNRISHDAFGEDMTRSAKRLCELLAPGGPSAGASGAADRLYELIADALGQIEQLSSDTTDKTKKTRMVLRRLLAQRDQPAWWHFVDAMKLTAAKKSGADAALSPLRAHAASVRSVPELHEDVNRLAQLLGEQVIELEARYRAYKLERGLVDFTDLETLLLELLESDELLELLRQDFDLVLVDEFQDTNPLQLAIFERLRALSPRTRWVGDPKQAIYGFRNTDPALVGAVWDNVPEPSRGRLTSNYRSQQGIVELTGRLFEPLFGDEAIQEPQRPPQARGVERWVFQAKNQRDDAMAMACGIATLHDQGVAYRDMAVLMRTNSLLDTAVAALEQLGIPYRRESAGLLSTRECALAVAGLRLVADRYDALAAATIVHLLGDPEEATPAWILERLQAVREAEQDDGGNSPRPWSDDPRLTPLEQIDPTICPPAVAVQQVIEALAIPALTQRWSDPAQRSAHLDSLVVHAREYEDSAVEVGLPATLTGLIFHLETMAAADTDVRFPPENHDAVTLSTYHGAKGLEWPVVVLGGLDWQRDPDMWSPAVVGGGTDVDDPLAGRRVRFWSWPFGKTDGPYVGRRKGSGLQKDALESDEGRQQAQTELDESLRLLYVGVTRARDTAVFAHRKGKYGWLQRLDEFDRILDPETEDGEHAIEGIETTWVMRRLSPDLAGALRRDVPDRQRWLAAGPVAKTEAVIPRYWRPSDAPATEPDPVLEATALGGRAVFPSGAEREHYSVIGDAVHGFLGAWPSLVGLDADDKAQVASRCIASFGVERFLKPEDLVDSAERFQGWVEKTFPGARWHTEVPVTGPREGGGQWTGFIDLVLQLNDGDLVVIDHKSAPIRTDACAAKAATFSGQVGAYRDLLGAIGETIVSSWIHFALAGQMVMIDGPVEQEVP